MLGCAIVGGVIDGSGLCSVATPVTGYYNSTATFTLTAANMQKYCTISNRGGAAGGTLSADGSHCLFN